MRRQTHVWFDRFPSHANSHLRSRSSRRTDLPGWSAGLCAAVALLTLMGCGTNVETLVAQTGSAAATTVLDLLLTDFANQVADAFDRAGQPPAGDVADAGDGGGAGDEADGGDTAGGPAAGETTFDSSGCGACHCADAGGGCALDAPSLVGVDAGTLDQFLRGGASHPGGKFDLDDQSITDLQAYLDSL